MKTSKILFVFILVATLFSCEKYDPVYQNKDITFYGKNDFKRTSKLNGEKLQIKNDSTILPRGIDIVGDYIIIADSKGAKPIRLINKLTYEYVGGYGKRGQGPNEIESSPVIYSKDNTSFIIHDRSRKQIVGYTIESLLEEDKPIFVQKIEKPEACFSINMIDNNIYYIDYYGFENRIHKYDTVTKKTKGYGSLLFKDNALKDETFAEACLARTAHNKDKIVTAYALAPFFEIFDMQTKQWKSILTIDKFPPIYQEISVSNDFKTFSYVPDKTKEAFLAVDMSDTYIYLLYSGEIQNIDQNGWVNGSKLLVFDYDGNPIDYYELDTPIFTFKVVDDHSIIGLSSDVMIDLIKFNLNEK